MDRGRPFVGREDELNRLRGIVDRAREGDGRIALLSGEAGIGKTRLSDEVASHAAARGLHVTWGRCWEGEGAAPYWPWIQVLRSWSQLPRLAGLVTTALEESPELAAMMGSSRAASSGAGGVTLARGDGEQARFRLFDAMTMLVTRASEQLPLLVVLDDLHDADVPSLLLLRFLSRALRGVRVIVVGTHRPAEARLRPERAELLAKIAREAQVFPLARLGPGDVSAWMSGLGGLLPQDTLDAVVRITEGNPLFVEEMMHVLRERGLEADPLACGVPDGIRETIREHLGRLSPAARGLLDVASVVGRDFDAVTLSMLAGTTEAVIQQGLEESVALRVAIRRDAGFSFSHVLLRDELYGALDLERRRAAHRKLAQALRLETTTDGATLARAAHHAFEAAGAEDLDETLALAREAAARAMASLAFEEATEILGRGFDLMEQHGRSETRAGCQQLMELGRARILSAHPLGRETCARAADLAARLGEPILQAEAALAYGTEMLSARRDETMVRLLRTALERLPAERLALRARLLARLGAALVPSPDRDIERLTREALAIARGLDDPETLLYTLRFACGNLGFTLKTADRVVLVRETADLAGTLGRYVEGLPIACWLVAATLDGGDVAGSDRALEQVAQILTKLSHPHYQIMLPFIRAMRATIAGRFEEADRLGHAALAMAERAEHGQGRFYFVFHRLALQLARGDAEGMAEHEPMMLSLLEGFPAGRIFGAILHSLAGRPSEGAAGLAENLPMLLASAHVLPGIGSGALACASVGAVEHARSVYDALKTHEGRNPLIWGPGSVACMGPTSLVLGRLAVILGEHEVAAAHFRDALAFCAKIGAHAFLVQAEKELAAVSISVSITPPPSLPASVRAPLALVVSLEQRGDLWHLTYGERTVVLKHNKGLAYLEMLLRRPHEELHVAQLVGIEERGDAGPMLDPKAKDAYRRRAEELDDTIEEATRFGDEARVAKARAELEALGEELARAVGLGGRDRKAASTSERARVNVQRRIKDAIAKIAEQDAELGRTLEAFVKTGVFCSYAPPRA